jgi:hypothetical protein
MFSLFFATLTILSLVFLIVIPKYLEFRKVLGLDKLWREADSWSKKVRLLFWGIKSQVLGVFTVLFIAMPNLLELARSLDLEAVMPHDTARFISFWLALASGMLTVIFQASSMVDAAKAKPVE